MFCFLQWLSNTYRRYHQIFGIPYKAPQALGPAYLFRLIFQTLPTQTQGLSDSCWAPNKSVQCLWQPSCLSGCALPLARYDLHLLAASRFISPVKPCLDLQRGNWTHSHLSHSCVPLEQWTYCIVFVFLANLPSPPDHGLAKGPAQNRDLINSV